MMIGKGQGCVFIAWTENGFVYTEDIKKESIQNVIRILKSFHDDNPLRNGMVSEVLKQQSRIDEGWFLEILSMTEKEGLIKYSEWN